MYFAAYKYKFPVSTKINVLREELKQEGYDTPDIKIWENELQLNQPENSKSENLNVNK